MDRSIGDTVQQVNDLAQQLANVNAKIAALQDSNGSAAPLETTRQNLMDQLAQLSGAIAVAPDAEGGPIVTIGRQPLVQGTEAFKLEVSRDATGATQVTWASSGTPVDAQGELGGLLQVRDQQLPQYLDTLDQIAAAVIASVNDLHNTGAGMNGQVGDFFTGTGAADIALSDAVATNPAAIAAGAANLPGDSSIAGAIANLQNSALVGGQTTNDAAAGLLGQIGGDVQQATDGETTADAMKQQLQTQQQSVGGVSLDEEMVNLIKYQEAYGAASRCRSHHECHAR